MSAAPQVPLPRQLYTSTQVIAASPLSKVFCKEYVKKCVENPELIFTEEPFFLNIRKPSGAVVLRYGEPTDIRRFVRGGEDWRPTYDWLTGGVNLSETDAYGVVQLPYDDEVRQLMAEVQGIIFRADPRNEGQVKHALGRQAEMQKELQLKLVSARQVARKKADDKVKEVFRKMHNDLMVQWQRNVESGGGKYPPSDTEFCGVHVLHEEIGRANVSRKKVMEQFNKLANVVQHV